MYVRQIKGIDRIPHLFSSQYMYLIKQSKREVERERNNRPPRRLLYIHRPRLDIETKTYNDDLNVFYSSPPVTGILSEDIKDFVGATLVFSVNDWTRGNWIEKADSIGSRGTASRIKRLRSIFFFSFFSSYFYSYYSFLVRAWPNWPRNFESSQSISLLFLA
ncbi:Protein of unknown function [Cotesia congregata]|uniref:Uncharacterized protein n=1 Tax=Cotesia congregata TaxID=51543 RepID=A0A8J2H7Q7_COTCN|nr:Protein of unknown function [Cotesia congregata]